MSILGSILGRVFGRKVDADQARADGRAQAQAQAQAQTQAQAAPQPVPQAPSAPTQSAPAQTTPSVQPPVDVEAVLTRLDAEKEGKSNWRTSIVDLMKLLDLDPSLDNRRELARELGYTGDTDDTASMNIWLHRQVMRKLAENGGTVPPELWND